MLIELTPDELATVRYALVKQRDQVEDLIDTIRPYLHDNKLTEFRSRIDTTDAALAALDRPFSPQITALRDQLTEVSRLFEKLEQDRQNIVEAWERITKQAMLDSKRIDELEAAIVRPPAQVWEPLPIGEVAGVGNCDRLEIRSSIRNKGTAQQLITTQDNTGFIAILPANIRLCRLAPAAVALDQPDGPGWWAFEGSEWESEPIYNIDGVEYRGWQEEWNEKADRYWHRHELHLYEPVRYEDVKGAPFAVVLEVRWVHPGQAFSTRKRSGPYDGKEPILGFISPRYRWNDALYGLDTVVGKWWKLTMPWDSTAEKEK